MSCEWCQNSFEMDDTCHDEFKMWQGLAGPYYIPNVDVNGNISWTNTGNLPNPDPVNIKGSPGQGLEIEGIVETVADLPESGDDVWLVGEEEPYDGYIFVDGQWQYIGQLLLGPVGPQGPTGPQGEAGEGVPSGGAAGQVLAKRSGSDYDTEWVNQSGGGGTPGTNVPLMDGTAAVGSSTAFAREDHVHPSDTSRASAAALANAILKASSVVTVSANGTTTHSLTGLTANHEISRFGMYTDAACTTPIPENAPTADITITPGANSWTLLVENFSSTFYIRPTFILPQN